MERWTDGLERWPFWLGIISESGKPSTERINRALKKHIRKGSTIVHDCEKAHNALVRELRLVDERYKANTSDPVYLEQMALVNHLWNQPQGETPRTGCRHGLQWVC